MHSTRHVVMLVSAAVLAVGLAAAGKFAGDGAGGIGLARAERYVTVTGLAEREVTADLAVWPIQVTATGNDLGQVQTEIDQAVDALRVFLVGEGVSQEEIDPGRPIAIDLLALSERPEGLDNDVRYLFEQTLVVRSSAVDAVGTAAARIGELVKLGVTLGETGGPRYMFVGLTELKPEMIADAVAIARRAAERMVEDEEGRVGSIRRAIEGEVVVEARDGLAIDDVSAAARKRVRLSATVEFFLVP